MSTRRTHTLTQRERETRTHTHKHTHTHTQTHTHPHTHAHTNTNTHTHTHTNTHTHTYPMLAPCKSGEYLFKKFGRVYWFLFPPIFVLYCIVLYMKREGVFVWDSLWDLLPQQYTSPRYSTVGNKSATIPKREGLKKNNLRLKHPKTLLHA